MNLNDESSKAPRKTSIAVPEDSSGTEGKTEELFKRLQSGLRLGSLFKMWADVSKINYMSATPLEFMPLAQSLTAQSNVGLSSREFPAGSFDPFQFCSKSIEDLLAEQFPINVTSLLNEDNLWGCFYNFPELYGDTYSPVTRVREIEDVPELVDGVLTRDLVTACLTYLKRTPILGDFVYIKLDLSTKFLMNIDILRHYKYLVYLDLSSNYITALSVLSYLPYLQYLSVAFNRLNTVLEYDTPQWFLTEVHYKFNSVKRIRDLSLFWSITVLDLSHNNIKSISGLETLRYLRHLDLSFNHIQRLENLNNLRLLWLDVSYNNISMFEFGPQAGLWTLQHLEYLNLNENSLTSMKMFSGCIRPRELHARNNRLSMLLELAVYMRQMRRLTVLDLRGNPVCSSPGYKNVLINTFPLLLNLDANELNPEEQSTAKMDMTPDIGIFATRRLLRLLYIEQLSRATVSPYTPPADTTEVPLIVFVGYEALGKGNLARRLAKECSSHVELALQHTTAPYHTPGHFTTITRDKFDDMLLSGEFLTYDEVDGESYGLSRKQAFIKDGKVRIACMALTSALMLKQRARRPYLILCSSLDKWDLIKSQHCRRAHRMEANEHRHSVEVAGTERSTLQVMLSGRIIITGILHEILLRLPEYKEKSEFVMESECSLMLNSEERLAVNDFVRGVNLFALLHASSASLDEACKKVQENTSEINQMQQSLYSLYKTSQGTGEYNSYVDGQNSCQDQKSKGTFQSTEISHRMPPMEKPSSVCHPKSVDFSKYTSSTWKGTSNAADSGKPSKSVSFTTTADAENQMDTSGMLIEADNTETDEKSHQARSFSNRKPWAQERVGSSTSLDDLDLWLAFLTETGVVQASEMEYQTSEISPTRDDTKVDDPEMMLRAMDIYMTTPHETVSTTVRDEYEGINRLCPGLFWDTIMMDNPDAAYLKAKKIIRDIVNSQGNFKPMFDIDFANLNHYPTVQKRLANIREQIAPQRLFY